MRPVPRVCGDPGIEESKLGTRLHRAFMGEVGEEMCQAEVAHHATSVKAGSLLGLSKMHPC